MTASHSSRLDDRKGRHLVHPRWVWGGLAVAVAGMSVLGLGIALLNLGLSVIGVALLVIGAVSSVAGGVLYDAVPRLSVGREVQQIVHGDVHEGVSSRDMLRDPGHGSTRHRPS